MTDTLFVTGGSGFIGRAFVRHAVDAGWRVVVPTRTEAGASRLRAAGATPLVADLAQAGPWQRSASDARHVVHLAQPDTYGRRISRARALAFRDERLRMDHHLLEAVPPQPGQRIVYVGGTSYYGSQGAAVVDESSTPQPKGWGPYIAPAIEALDDYVARGWPVVQAFPSWVYGPGSWFVEYTLQPLLGGKPILKLPGLARTISFVHVEDVARALLHLLDHGEVGRRYFVTDDQPAERLAIGRLAAGVLGVPMKTLTLPQWLVRLAAGPVVADSLLTEARLSNARLKATGFTLRYPTLEAGVPDAIDRWRRQERARAHG